MLEGQENTAPTISRLPRLAPSPNPKSSIPTLSSFSASSLSKRKLPSSPMQPSAPKRQAINPLSQSTSISTNRKPSGSGFVPTARKPSSSSAAIARPVGSLVPGARSASSGSASVASGSGGGIRKATGAIAVPAGKRPPVSATGGRTGSTVGRTGVGARGVSPGMGMGMGRRVSPGMSRGVSPGMGPTSGIGSGMVGSAQFKNQDGRIDNVEKMVGGLQAMWEKEQAKINSLQMSQTDLQTLLMTVQNTEREARRELSSASEEISALSAKHAREVDELDSQIRRKERERRGMEDELKDARDELGRERETVRELKRSLAEQSTAHLTLNAQLAASQAQQMALQAEIERATMTVSAIKAELEIGRQRAREVEEKARKSVEEIEEDAKARVREIEEELRAAESIRRKLHNQVQELKGNIRVFARVRPALSHESDQPDALADITYGDERKEQETGQSQIIITNRTESATGKEREQVSNFVFDKVFQPKAGQKEVFEEISMLAQSVLDGYNVCIFAYGQTGSGKSWTMEGGQTDESAGMISRAIDMIFTVSGQLQDRGWKYHMEGQFLEVYNEVINDLLGSGQFDTKKHEIKLDREGKMSVTDVVSIPLSNPRQVSTLLERARSRRAVAATLMNERSSRSHSVFTLKVRGINPLTDEKCEAMLNLVDLAGSERLASSGAGENKDRLKETININKSLSALADVIGALGQGQMGGHVPYRNSTLTRLLQTSLSGSSKTLMMCNLSPLGAHLGESLCSLRFATKVNTTVVGRAQKNVK